MDLNIKEWIVGNEMDFLIKICCRKVCPLMALVALVLLGSMWVGGCGRKSPQGPIGGPVVSEKPVACTMEAKQCPDGNFVGRVGPDCAFAECPK
jgi:hypothetical protein